MYYLNILYLQVTLLFSCLIRSSYNQKVSFISGALICYLLPITSLSGHTEVSSPGIGPAMGLACLGPGILNLAGLDASSAFMQLQLVLPDPKNSLTQINKELKNSIKGISELQIKRLHTEIL